MADDHSFDVFLSHNSADKAAVEALASRLRGDGLRPFLDKWHLVPGRPWQKELADALEQSECTAIFFGPSGEGAWHNEEMQVALNKAARTRDDYRAIPVLLPGANPSQISGFLGLRSWVDFRSGLSDQSAYERLLAAIRGVAPESGAELGELPDEPRPYQGLGRFEDDQHEFFFGRDGEVRRLIDRMKQDRFIAVVGASGSGKSSLIRAGLATDAAQEHHPGIRNWQRITLLPGNDALRAVANEIRRVADRLGKLPGPYDPVQWVDKQVERFRRGADGLLTTLVTLFGDECDSGANSSRVLLVVDQFEELFTQRPESPENLAKWRETTACFAANLRAAYEARVDWLRIIVTLRADFVDRFAGEDFPDLRLLLEQRQFWLAEMSEDELREAVVFPAKRRGAFFEKGLVEIILRDMRRQTGALPLLEEALLTLWMERRGPWLTHDAYQRSGGVGGALAAKADGIYNDLSPRDQQLARRIFLALVQLGEGTADTRRRIELANLVGHREDPEEVAKVLERFTAPTARLVTVSSAADGADTAEITHEALFTSWIVLREWIDKSRDDLRFQRRLDEAARHWDQQNRPEGVLWRSPDLDALLAFRERTGEEMSPLQMDFCIASESAEQRRLAERESRQQRLRAYLRTAVTSAVVAILLAAASIGLYLQMRSARNSERVAHRAQRLAHQRALASTLSLQEFADDAEKLTDVTGTQAATIERILSLVKNTYDESLRNAGELEPSDYSDLLAGKAEVYNSASRIHRVVGSSTGMIADARVARDLYLEIVATDPRSEWQAGLARSHRNLAWGLFIQGRLADSLVEDRKSLAIAEELLRADTNRLEWKALAAKAHAFIGLTLSAQGDAAGHEAAAREAFRLRQELVAGQPDHVEYQRGFATSRAQLADFAWYAADYETALIGYQAALEVHQRLAAQDPTNARWQQDVVIALSNLGDTYTALEDRQRCYQQGLQIASQSSAEDPSNRDWERLKLKCEFSLHDVRRDTDETKRFEDLLAIARDQHAIAVARLASDDKNDQWQGHVAMLNRQQAQLMISLAQRGDKVQQNLRDSRPLLDEAIRISRARLKTDNTNWHAVSLLAATYAASAQWHAAQGNADATVEEMLKSSDELIVFCQRALRGDPDNVSWRHRLASTCREKAVALFTGSRYEQCLELLRESQQHYQRLFELQRTNVSWRLENLAVLHLIADIIFMQENYTEFEGLAERYVDAAQQLANEVPADPEVLKDLAEAHKWRYVHASSLDDQATALESYGMYLDTLERLYELDAATARELVFDNKQELSVLIAAGRVFTEQQILQGRRDSFVLGRQIYRGKPRPDLATDLMIGCFNLVGALDVSERDGNSEARRALRLALVTLRQLAPKTQLHPVHQRWIDEIKGGLAQLGDEPSGKPLPDDIQAAVDRIDHATLIPSLMQQQRVAEVLQLIEHEAKEAAAIPWLQAAILQAAGQADQILPLVPAAVARLDEDADALTQHSRNLLARLAASVGEVAAAARLDSNVDAVPLALPRLQVQMFSWNLEAAESLMQQMEAVAPTTADVTVSRAQLYLLQRRLEEAKTLLEKLLAAPDFPPTHVPNTRLFLAIAHDELGDTAKAIDQMRKLLEQTPDNIYGIGFLAYFQLRRGDSLDEAEKGIARAISLAPNDWNMQYLRGWLLAVHKHDESGLAILEQLARQVAFSGNPIFLDQLGDAYQAHGRDADAQHAWSQALKAFPATTAATDPRRTSLLSKLENATNE